MPVMCGKINKEDQDDEFHGFIIHTSMSLVV